MNMGNELEVIATNDEYGNNPYEVIRIVNVDKLSAIYKALRSDIFIGKPIQENQGDNNLVYRTIFGPRGNYGWQLFRTGGGTAMLEYRGRVSYWPHERSPYNIESEEELEEIFVTFHQLENSINRAREIVERHTKVRS